MVRGGKVVGCEKDSGDNNGKWNYYWKGSHSE